MPGIKFWIPVGLIIFSIVIGLLFSPIFFIFSGLLIAVGAYLEVKQGESSSEEETLDSREIPVEIDQSKSERVFKKEQTLNNQEVLIIDDQNKSIEVSESSDNSIRQSKALAIKMKIKEKEGNKEEIEEEETESSNEKINNIQGWGDKPTRTDLVFIVVGILLLLIYPFVSVISSISAIFLYLGVLFLGAGLYLVLKNMLRKEQVLDSWGMLIKNGQGKFDTVFQDTESFITESKAPSLEIRKDKMAPGIIGSLFGAKRDFLVVKDKQSSMLSPYQIFINARDYGNNLDVSWYLTYRPSMWEALVGAFRSKSPMALEELDLFELQDLTAYTAVCHHSTLDAVINLMLELNQDTSKIDRKSKGFLGIS